MALNICLFYTGSKTVVKVDYGLSAVLVVLVGLNCYAGKSRIAGNIVGLSENAVACGKTVLEKFKQVYLTAGCCKCIEIQVVNMDIAVYMCL